MIQIRNNVFETNSSSTHSLCISKKEPINKPTHIEFYLDWFGWEEGAHNLADYIYTAIMVHDTQYKTEKPWLPRLRSFLIKNNITWYFDGLGDNCDEWGYDFGIDHAYELLPSIYKLLDNQDMLARALFNNESVVYTGNDNDSDEDSMCFVAYRDEWRYDKDKNDWVKIDNPVYNHPDADQDNFDYFYKGN